MTIAHVESLEDLNLLMQELGEHSDEESMRIVEESDAEVDEDTAGLRDNYNSLLKKLGEYARVAKVAVKKMKKVEEDYRSLLVRYNEAKCEIEMLNGELNEIEMLNGELNEIEMLNGELNEAYIKVKFIELEVIRANAKIDRVSTKKLDDVISSQKTL